MSLARLPRFHPTFDKIRLELTERDREMLRLVQRHRFLRPSHLVAMLNGSRQTLLRRLQRLYHSGYLDRPRAQLDYFSRGGSRTIVHGLRRKGAIRLNPKS